MVADAKGGDEGPDGSLSVQSAVGVNYEYARRIVVDDAAARPSFILGGHYESGVALGTKLPDSKSAPVLPPLVMAPGMCEAVTIELGQR